MPYIKKKLEKSFLNVVIKIPSEKYLKKKYIINKRQD